MHLRQAGERLLNLLLPHICPGCDRQVTDTPALCLDCWQALTFITDPACAACGLPFELPLAAGSLCLDCAAAAPAYDRARAAFLYDDISRRLVLNLKHGDRTDTAGLLAQWMGRAGRDMLTHCDLVAPVPLHRGRLFQRRYNQSALLADAIADAHGLPHLPRLLRRSRATPSQGQLGRNARRRNMSKAFQLGPDARRPGGAPKGRRILLVDDVLTTGATAGECAKVLKQAGAAHVDVLTLARVAPPDQ